MESKEDIIDHLELIKSHLWCKSLTNEGKLDVIRGVCDLLLNQWILTLKIERKKDGTHIT